MKEAVIASAVRTAVGKAYKGTLHATRPDDLAAVAITNAIGRVPGLDPKEIEDVVLGCAMPEPARSNHGPRTPTSFPIPATKSPPPQSVRKNSRMKPCPSKSAAQSSPMETAAVAAPKRPPRSSTPRRATCRYVARCARAAQA